ncbi:MAG: outer membrane protein assembly factor BamA [Spirochaetales bacterium]|nr:outer membrane protein assembly factor BamA [Spirochaetales bacterium]
MNRKLLITFIILMISTASAIFAQAADWYIGKPIAEIKFNGLNNIDENELKEITDQFVGQEFTDTLFWDLQSKLYALNYFDNFSANALPPETGVYDKVVVVFDVTEKPLVKSINFRGNKNMNKSKLLDAISIKEDDILNNAKVRMDEGSIRNLYIEEGYPDIEVDSNTEDSSDEGFVDLYFSITEGRQQRVDSISFSGNTFASERTLRNKLESKQQSFFNKGIFQNSYIEKDKAAIEKYYADSGYIDAKVTDVAINDVEKEDDDKNYVSIVYYIDEGELWTFGGFTLEGNELYTTEELLGKVKSEIGKNINRSNLQADLTAISDTYYNDGYIYNEIRPNEIRDEQTNSISYNITINEKSRAHIDNIIIKGNEKTKDEVILREIPLEEGDIFSKNAVMQGLNNLYNTQYFSSVVPEMPYGSENGLMDLVVNVEEQNTTNIQFGVSFTSSAGDIPIVGFLKWSDTNLKGTGRDFSISLSGSATSQKLSFGLTDNWLFGKRISGGIDFSLSHNLYSSVAQDILLPIFTTDGDDDDQVVPDPYDGHWVWADDGTYNGVSHEEGEDVDLDSISDEDLEDAIDDEDIVTDYDYAMDNDGSIDDEYLMDYHSFEASISASGGYTKITRLGKFALGVGIGNAESYAYYDESQYRAYDKDTRDYLGRIIVTDKTWITASWDTRDLIYSPTKGFILKETLTYTGGILFGYKQYIKTKTDFDVYFKLLDIPVTEKWSLQSVLGFHGQFSLILPQFGYMDTDDDGTADAWSTGVVATRSDLLYIDGMFIGRGWDTNYDNRALIDAVLDLTMPIVSGAVSWNTFLSGTGVWEEPSDLANIDIDDFYFSLGTGIQIDIPSFPISFFLVKRGKFSNHEFELQEGDWFTNDDSDVSGIDFVLTFDIDYF